ncbi:MAG: hypothetical protein ACI92G_000798 [Candidatus Pelagisphaera sp.]|jgi:hypothetical protein
MGIRRIGKLALFGGAMALFGFGARAETVLDVLVVYTSRVEAIYDDSDGVRAHVLSSIASANLSFENSDVDLRLRLREVEKIDYEESQVDMEIDLEYITSSSAISSLRDEVGADLVCLFRGSAVNDGGLLISGVAQTLDDVPGNASTANRD